MVIVGDIIGNDDATISKYIEEVKKIAIAGNGDTFVAKTPEARHQYWAERSKTSAISKHTNAFKLNEDVVIPLDKIGEYTDACELFNICCSIRNKLEMLNAVATYLGGPIKLGQACRFVGRLHRERASGAKAAACDGAVEKSS